MLCTQGPALCAGLVRTRLCRVVRRVVRNLVCRRCAHSCAQLCACVQTVVRSKVVRRSCAHTILVLAAVHKFKDLCVSHFASIEKSVHNPLSSGTTF